MYLKIIRSKQGIYLTSTDPRQVRSDPYLKVIREQDRKEVIRLGKLYVKGACQPDCDNPDCKQCIGIRKVNLGRFRKMKRRFRRDWGIDALKERGR